MFHIKSLQEEGRILHVEPLLRCVVITLIWLLHLHVSPGLLNWRHEMINVAVNMRSNLCQISGFLLLVKYTVG